MTTAAGASPARARFGLAIVCAGALVGPFDTTVNTAFPVITEAFGVAQRDIQWVVIAFVLAQSALGVLFGHLGDRFGHRRIFAIGLLASAVAHAAVALSTDFRVFVAMRAVQGVAVGITLSCAPALATLMFPAASKGRVLAVYAAVASLGMAIAPWIGGLLLETWGWPGVYWFRVPLALAALVLLAGAPTGERVIALDGASGTFDWPGALGLPAVMAALSFAVALLGRGVASPSVLGLLLAGAAGAVLLARHESRVAHPVIRIDPFRSPVFSALQLASVGINLVCFANLLVLPYVLVTDLGVRLVDAGALLAGYPGGAVLGNLAAARHGIANPLRAMITGMVLASAGLACTAVALASSGVPAALAVGMVLSGFGLGVFNVGYMDATTSLIPAAERGVAGSLLNVTRLGGVLLGAATIGGLASLAGGPAACFALLAGALTLGVAGFVRIVRNQPPLSSGAVKR